IPYQGTIKSHVLQSVSALESIILRSFGPEGGQVLFTRDTGRVMLSRSGERILTALHLEHPLARMVVECVWKHSTITGDGSKTFVLLLASLLRMIRATAAKEPHMSRLHNSTAAAAEAATARHLADRLLEFALTELDGLIALNVLPHGSRVSLDDITAKTPPEPSFQTLLLSFFHTRLGNVHCEFFRDLMCELLSRWMGKTGQPSSSFRFIDNNFPALHTQVSGLPAVSSRLIEGHVIHRDFATPWPQQNRRPVKAVVFSGYLQPRLLAAGDVLELGGEESVTEDASVVRFSSWTERSLESVIATLQSFGVSVLLCALKQSSAALALAAQAGMGLVECVSDEEMSLFAQLSGVTPVPDSWAVHPEHIATLTFCKPLILGTDTTQHIMLNVFCICTHTLWDAEERLKVKPCSLVICGPGEEQTDQYARAFQAAIRMLLTAWEPVDKTEISTLDVKETFISNKCTSLPTDAISGESACTSCSMHPHQKCVIEPGCVIPAGGTFEFLLHHALHQYDRSCSVSVSISAFVPVSHILANALLSVPRQIYSHNRKRFLQAQTRVMALAPQQSHILGARLRQTDGPPEDGKQSARSCRKDSAALTLLDLGLESVSCKYHLVLAVVQCLTSLLRVNKVLRTHTVLHTTSHKLLSARLESPEDVDKDESP
uniref:Bardet-Biedl syndrome 10 n=1 Tax=Fundulus heteroclitus TaxID=8078 RepID=A0A3Q2Q8L0_FUNHE